MTLKEFRASRVISQVECAKLLGVNRDYVRYRDKQKLTLNLKEAIDDMLERGPHSFIQPRYFYPDPTGEPMPAQVRRRLPLGSCYLSLEYFQPDTLEIAQSRKDLLAKVRSRPSERWFVLRRLIRRGKAGVQVVGVYLPTWYSPTI